MNLEPWDDLEGLFEKKFFGVNRILTWQSTAVRIRAYLLSEKRNKTVQELRLYILVHTTKRTDDSYICKRVTKLSC